MKRTILTILAGIMVMTVAHASFAEDVYITKHGKRFHKELCKVTRNKEVQKLDRQAAELKGLKPCQSCFKEEKKDDQVMNENQNPKIQKM